MSGTRNTTHRYKAKKKEINLYWVVHQNMVVHSSISGSRPAWTNVARCLHKRRCSQPGNVADFGIAERKLGKIKAARGGLKSSSF